MEGGCYCGAIRYRVSGAPTLRAQCYCRACQHVSGGGPNEYALIEPGDFAYADGSPTSYRRPDLPHAVTREFCSTCGTHVLTRRPGLRLLVLKVGTLDDPDRAGLPALAIFCAEKAHFHFIPDDIPCVRWIAGSSIAERIERTSGPSIIPPGRAAPNPCSSGTAVSGHPEGPLRAFRYRCCKPHERPLRRKRAAPSRSVPRGSGLAAGCIPQCRTEPVGTTKAFHGGIAAACSLRYDIAPLLERVRVPTSILWRARETQVGVATGRRLAALRPDIPFTLINNTKPAPNSNDPGRSST